MLKFEFYSVLDGVMVRAYAVPTGPKPLIPQVKWDTIQRVVQVEDMEDMGLPEAIIKAVVELVQLYPELVKGAIE